jgi:uncharacterized SAM-dependent methyltransferase
MQQKQKSPANGKINDLIFKELLKRGYYLEGNTRVWNLGDSKLWYLSSEQAQDYLNLEDEKQYKRDVTQKEIDLINNNLNDILRFVGNEPLNIIDIGCGDGRKAALFIEKLRGKVKLRYCPIDISSYMVEKAIARIKSMNVGEVVKFQWNISDFENIENITSLLRQGEFKKNLILLMGNTLGNFEIHELLYELRSSMNSGDVLLIGNGLDNRHPEDIVKSYNSKFFDKFSFGPIKQLGLSESDVEFGVRFRNSRIESFYTIKNPKTIRLLQKEVRFEKGDQIIVIISYKYAKDDFMSFLKMYFGSVELFVSKDGSYALALCKK